MNSASFQPVILIPTTQLKAGSGSAEWKDESRSR